MQERNNKNYRMGYFQSNHANEKGGRKSAAFPYSNSKFKIQNFYLTVSFPVKLSLPICTL